MKKTSFLLIVAMSALLFTACDKNKNEPENTIKLDTLAGTMWVYGNSENYIAYAFYIGGDAVCGIKVEGEDEVDLSLNWTCTSSGDVTTTVKVTGNVWKTGHFDKYKGTLEMGGLDYKLVE